MSEYRLETVTAQPFGFLRLEATLPEMAQTIGNGFLKLGELFGKADAKMAGAPYAHYLMFYNGKAAFELGFPIAESDAERLRGAGVQIGSTPAGQVLKGIHTGPYETVNQTYESMGADLKARNLSGTSDMWERYYSPPGTPPEKTMTEVIWPISDSSAQSPAPRGDTSAAPTVGTEARSANRFVHVDISADDPKRAADFYHSVFGWSAQELPGPQPYWLISTDPSDPTAIGAGIGKRTESWQRVAPTIEVTSADEAAARVVDAGGAIVAPKTTMPGVGQLVAFKDTEGNVLLLLEPSRAGAPALDLGDHTETWR